MGSSIGKISKFEGIWLDATDRKREGKWVWNNGGHVKWFNWLRGDYFIYNMVITIKRLLI